MNRSKKSMLNAISAGTLNIINGIMGFIVTKLIITTYGSDFNGVNATANQLVVMLMVLEGGFTIAANVALFKPMIDKKYDQINKIFVATKLKYQKIGIIFLTVGIILCLCYSVILKTKMITLDVFLILIMAILPAAVNLYFSSKYKILLQAEQKEYIITLVNIITITLGYICNIVVVYVHLNILFLRLTTMIFSIIQCLIIVSYCKKNYSYIKTNVTPDFESIKGTTDLFIQKITSMTYNTMPIMFIGLFSSGGTKLASVYAVYNSIISLVKNFLYSILDAPRLSLGQLIVDSNKDYLYLKFIEYEYIVVYTISIILTTMSILIIPFIKIYTLNINDINYIDINIAFLMCITSFFELIHIPSGNLINMAGYFKTSKYIQFITALVLVIISLIGVYFFGIYGILFAVFIASLILCILEIGFVHIKYFNNFRDFLKILLSNACFCIIIFIIHSFFKIDVEGYFEFILYAIFIFIGNFFIITILNLLINRTHFLNMKSWILNFINK